GTRYFGSVEVAPEVFLNRSRSRGGKAAPPVVGHPMASVLAIANQKGGVGKTTTAVNLAASLAVGERRTLLVDMDPQGNASTGCGVRVDDGGTYRVLLEERAFDDEVQRTELDLLHVLPASPDLAAIERELALEEDRAFRLRRVLKPVLDRYDYVLVDCPPSLGVLTINALTAADHVIVPLQCEYYALEGLTQLSSTIERVRSGLNASLEVHGVALTMFDARNNLAREVADEVRGHFRVYESVIPRNVRLAEAPSHGRPVILYDAASRGCHRYLSLAREILDDLEGEAA
ncbi:MAG: ParA family protein, partial [Myxococcota bacterium]